MKKIIFCLACSVSASVFFFGQRTPEQISDLTLENIEVVGLSAAETECEGTNDVDCYTYNEHGIVSGKSKGPLKQWR